MEDLQRTYIAIDLKSFFASVECVERNLNPLTTNLVVADESRTTKTICLAVTPSLKAYGISGRARLFEVVQRVNQINLARKRDVNEFKGSSYNRLELEANKELEVSYIVAPPRMAYYMDYSKRIYGIYLRYFAPEDMHVYSIDEVFMDATHYLKNYGLTPRELAMKIIKEVLRETGITATAGIGTNMYLCKVAMDIEAKHIEADENGVRIAQLDEKSYRRNLWNHRPITDFWRVGRGYAKRLQECGIYTMGEVARCSIGKDNEFYNEELLYKLFGVNAELLIDHAWGYEPCTIKDIKAYRPDNNSVCSGQVLQCPYSFENGATIVREMVDLLVLDLVEKGLVTNQIVLTVGYDIENLENEELAKQYKGEIKTDLYGRKVPKSAHGTKNIGRYTSSTRLITQATLELYNEIMNRNLSIRRVYITANHVIYEKDVKEEEEFVQLDLFTDYKMKNEQKEEEEKQLKKERAMQEAMISIKNKYGKNAILKGTNFREGATTRERNSQIGGHKA